MKNLVFYFGIILSFVLMHYKVDAQTQSLILPISGSNGPNNPSSVLNFLDPTTPSVNALPYTQLTVNNVPRDPHDENYLELSDIPIYDAYVGQHPMYGQTVVNDADGNLLFFIVDNNIYNRYGVAMIDV
jgi:hypothetical protein